VEQGRRAVIDLLRSVDIALFVFINSVLSNPVGDVAWPIITDYDKLLPARIMLLALWLGLMTKGGRRGRVAAVLLIPLLLASDQLSSSVIKPLFQRPRPCHTVDGVAILPYVRLLVNCGGGMAFPSSHAVNNFAVATLFGWTYRRYAFAFYLWAAIVAISRVAVGVHYPSDVAGGAVLGCGVAALMIALWTAVERRLPAPLGTKSSSGSSSHV
jgi:undecaprenyl-diphosphatase